ncbi:MAG: phosphodiester glycosidase family protein [Dictyoglomaceae bacterium]
MKRLLKVFLFLIFLISSGFSQEINIAPNVSYQKIEKEFLTYHMVIIQFPNSNIDILSVLAQDQVLGKEKLSSIAKRYNADLVINGNFFDLNTGEPVGIFVSNGELVRLPIKRGAFGVTYDGRAVIDIFETSIKFKIDDKIVKIDNLNSPRGGNQAVLYTKKFAKTSIIQKNALAGVNIIIETQESLPFHGKIAGKVINIEYGVLSSNIPENGCVLSLGGLALRYLPLFTIGKEIEIIVESKPTIPIKEAIGGGPILLKDGEIVLGKTNEISFDRNIIEGKHPRTVVGIKQDKIYLFFIEGRKEHNPGMSLREVAELLKTLGIENALNLDGGGSSNMIIWQEPVVNNEREISTALILKNITPFTSPKYLTLFPQEDIYLQKGEKKKISLLLQDENFHKLEIPLSSLTWTLSNPIINFNLETMEIEALESGESKLSINIGDLKVERNIFVYPETFIEDFEVDKNWKITGRNFDLIFTTYTLTNEKFYEGSNSLSLSYKTLDGDSFVYLELNIPLSPKASRISLKVLGDNKKGWLRALFYDNNGKPYVLDLTPYKGIDWDNEWRTIEKEFSELKPLISSWNLPPVYPLKLHSIYIVFLNAQSTEGKIYIDDLKIESSQK